MACPVSVALSLVYVFISVFPDNMNDLSLLAMPLFYSYMIYWQVCQSSGLGKQESEITFRYQE